MTAQKLKIGFDGKRALMNHSGLGSYSRNLLHGLVSNYPENEYVVYSPSEKAQFRELLDQMTNGHLVYQFPSVSRGKIRQALWRTYKLAEIAQSDKIDLYHGLSHELPSGLQKTGIPSVVTIHDLIFERYPSHYPWIDRLFYRKKIKEACETASRIVAISQRTQRDLEEFYHIDPSRVQVIYQSCEQEYKILKDQAHLMQVRDKYRLPEEYVLCVGSFVERKNQITLLKSIKFLRGETDIKVVLVGTGGRYEDRIRKFIKERGMQQSVIIISHCSTYDLSCIYQMAKVFVYPSLFEGFGIPIIEAMESGIPVITSNGSCFKETGGNACVYIDALNEKQLANEILGIIGSESNALNLVMRGKEHVANFSTDKIAKDYMALYRHIV